METVALLMGELVGSGADTGGTAPGRSPADALTAR
jgi:hypothetical protein